MKENKIAIICTCVIIPVSFLASLILQNKGLAYFSNLFSGVFASGILTLTIAIINYRVFRRRTLESFYSYAMKAAQNFNQFENDGNIGNIERSIDSVLLMAQFDYSGLDTAYGDICFLFKNQDNRNYIYDKIYSPIIKLKKAIIEKSYHFKEYKKAKYGNEPVMKEFIKELDGLIMERQYQLRKVGNSTEYISFSSNKMVETLTTELNGRYYVLMYGKKLQVHITK